MGVILEPTAAMSPWRVEARSRSAYISGGLLRGHRADENADLHIGYAVNVPQAAGLLAAFDQIIEHPGFQESSDAHAPDCWTTWEVKDDWIYLDGPCYVYGLTGVGWVIPTGSTFEIDYATLLDARNLLHVAFTTTSEGMP